MSDALRVGPENKPVSLQARTSFSTILATGTGYRAHEVVNSSNVRGRGTRLSFGDWRFVFLVGE